MFIDTDQMVSVTELQKQLPKFIRSVDTEKTKIFVSKRNKVKAVILSADEYENLMKAVELLEDLEISKNIEKRMKNYKPENNVSWEEIKDKYGL
ncbi:type II toxin-antitoxin system Phd/YefM family antitoxin [Desulfonauticus submarinus]